MRHWGGFVSAIIVDAAIGNMDVIRLGDSSQYLHAGGMLEKGPEGIKELKAAVQVFYEASKDALAECTGIYKDFFAHAVEDFEGHGLNMPHYGKIM